MSGCIGGIDGDIGDVVARQRLDALIDIGGAVIVTMEADVAEVGLDEAGLQVSDADGRIGHVDAESVGQCLHGSLSGAIHVATGVGGITGYGTHVDDVTAVALHHPGHHEARHRQQSLDVGVDHRLPVIKVALVFRLQPQGQSGIIHQHVDLLPVSRKVVDIFLGLLAVSHVKGERQHFRPAVGQFLPDGSQTVLVAACQDQTVAIGGELPGTGKPNAARCACNQYYLIHIQLLFLISDDWSG